MSQECMYYRWNAGYYCDLKYEKKGSGDISDYEVNHYCWYGQEYKCPLYKNRGDSGGCFLTSACVESKGLPDDCRELQVLRNFRDTYLAELPGGKEEISKYYAIAPAIVDAIQKLPNASSTWAKLYQNLVIPCVELIDAGDLETAYRLYRRTVHDLKIYFMK